MKLPHFLLNLLPLWSYICPKCKREVPKNSHKCPFCGERYGKPLKAPPSCLKSKETLERYVHEKVFPRISAKQRKYLAQFFTELFSDGFESGDISAWSGTYTSYGSVSVVSDIAHHGTYSLKSSITSTGGRAVVYKTITGQDDLYVRVYVNFGSLPDASGEDIWFITIATGTPVSGEVAKMSIYHDGSGIKLRVHNFANGISYYSSDYLSINTDTWYCFELHLKRGDSDGILEAWVDGTLKIQQTNIDTNTGSAYTNVWVGQNYCDVVCDIWVDCVVFADTYIGPEGAVTEIQVSDSAIGQEVFSRPYREIPFTETALGQELLAKTRNLNLSDIATSLETIQKARQIGIVTDIAQGLERILKQRLITLADQASGLELTSRPTRIILITDEALSNEIIGKLRELTSITDSAIGIEYVSIGTEDTTKTKIFLLLGDLAIQLTGN